ncbi:MAG: EF-P beta-lysylation protein EpmB [Gammaproteobacteria bacterium]|nr:EF-P beta-lysylation protein EpmB [Gammaproteobacteria bacterium]
MIPKTVPTWQRSHQNLPTPDWQRAQANAIRDPEVLLDYLELPQELLPAAIQAANDFPLCVPLTYLQQIEKGNPADPLLRQILPIGAERNMVPGFRNDPVGDQAALVVPGLLHKYQGRVLLMTTQACAVHCRYCFRRHYPYSETGASPGNWQAAIDYIAADESIHEVILSGGDPLSLTESHLSSLSQQLSRIPHLSRLRIHSRTPVVLPERINEAFVQWLASVSLNTVLVLHCNHPDEISEPVRNALNQLKKTGVTLLNQAVLLHGVNDDLETLTQLSEKLFQNKVMPYYLHQLDRVQGAAHFEVPDNRATELITLLRQQLPGYLVPQLVREQAAEKSKTPVVI